MSCIQCNKPIHRKGQQYCSNQCQSNFRYEQYILAWRQGIESGERGLKAKNISRHIRRYLFDKYGSICAQCGWNKRNEITGEVPLEIDHIDGNASNNKEENLRLICPNCHALTANFRNLNKGKGREWRRLKYTKSI